MAVNRTKVLEAAQKFLSKGQYDKAVVEYQKLVAEDPRDVRTLLKIGDLHTRRHKPKEAIDVYERVADLYAKQGFFLKAVAVYKQILKLDPAHLEATQKLAKMYEELALTSDALSTYELVADAFLAQGQTDKALATMERMIEIDGQNVAVRIKHAEALSKAGKAHEAATAFAAGAQLLKEQGRMDDYLRVVERQLYHDPESVPIARELAGLYLERSDPKRALAKLQVCFKADPRDVRTLDMLAEAFRQLGQTAKTISVLKEIVRLHADGGDDAARVRTLERVLELDPGDADAQQALSGAAPAQPRAVDGTAGPTAAPPPRKPPMPVPPPPPVVRAAPPPEATQEEEIELEAADDIDLVEESDPADEVLIVDDAPETEVSGTVTQTSPEDEILSLLADADAREGAGDYEGAVGALQRVLDVEPDHVLAHERLKDIYIAADRRVDAVKELLWLSTAVEPDSLDRATQYAESAYELAPRSEATRKRLLALGALPEGDPSLTVRGGIESIRRVTHDEPVSEQLEVREQETEPEPQPLSEPPLEADDDPVLEADDDPVRDVSALLEIPLLPDEFDAPAPRRARAAGGMSQAELADLLEVAFTPEEFDAPRHEPARARSDYGAEPPSPFASTEFAPFGPAPGGADSRQARAPGRPMPPPTRRERAPQQPLARPDVAAPLPPTDRAPVELPIGRPSVTARHDGADDGSDKTEPDGEVPAQLREPKVAPMPADEPAAPSPASRPEALPARGGSHSGPRSRPSDTTGGVPVDVEEVLDEAAFFASQGLLDEALELVQEAILIYPSSDLLKQRLGEYEHQADLRDAAPEAAAADQSFDIAEQLAKEPVAVAAPSESEEMVDVESVFAQFKKGVAAQIAPDDSETHFDLGIAYKEMGLIGDAVNEFELAARSPKRAATALTMIGTCHLERGDGKLAINYFQRALQLPQHAPGEELALHYEIANAHEQLGELDQALASYEKVASRDRSFRGVTTRLEQLKQRGVKSARVGR